MVDEMARATLTELEARLIESVRSGTVLDLTGDRPRPSGDEMKSWDSAHDIRAWVIRDLLTGRLLDDPDPRGVRLCGARVLDRMDLRGVTSDVPLDLLDCHLPGGVELRDAKLRDVGIRRCLVEQVVVAVRTIISGQLSFSGSRFNATSHVCLIADGLRVGQDLTLAGLTLDGAARLVGARIGGRLVASGTVARSPGIAIDADGIQIGQDLKLDRNFTANGTVRLVGAQVGGEFDATAGTFTSSSGSALIADGLKVEQSLILGRGFNATGAGAGAVRLTGAHIGGRISAAAATIDNPAGSALIADGLRVDQDLDFGDGFIATGDGEYGAVRLLGAQIAGLLILRSAQLVNTSGPALYADRLQVGQSLLMLAGLDVRGAGGQGALRLYAAQIAGSLMISGSTIHNASGPAISAGQMGVGADMTLQAGLIVTGAVRLWHAHIGGSLNIRKVSLSSISGPALDADGLKVDHDLFLGVELIASGSGDGAVRFVGAKIGDGSLKGTINNPTGTALLCDGMEVANYFYLEDGFNATGSGSHGAVSLLNAHIRGQLGATGAVCLSNQSGPALNAAGMRVELDLLIRAGFAAVGAGEEGVVRFDGTQVRTLDIELDQIRDTSGRPGDLHVDGLEYTGLPEQQSVTEWLAVLAHRTPRYAAQPYRQLAAATQAAGHDGDTRRIMIAQREDQLRRRTITGKSDRIWVRLTGFLLGYGYQPWRALLGLLVVIGASVALSTIVGGHGGLRHTPRAAVPNVSCTMVERVGVGLDLSVPLIRTGARDICTTTATAAGDTVAVAGWILQMAAWAFATLFIAGFTGAVRKT
ncbi:MULTISPECIES: hypothetical protein [unclassified Kribbella]|uniref:hypothetical protein n=1 Tax=unclassified Kribbella TaxID=2644121 RepID=UPI00307883B6